MAKLINDWDGLKGLENDRYRLEIEEGRGLGWIIDKETNKEIYYLSTHTFYDSHYSFWTKILQECGFDIELESWG